MPDQVRGLGPGANEKVFRGAEIQFGPHSIRGGDHVEVVLAGYTVEEAVPRTFTHDGDQGVAGMEWQVAQFLVGFAAHGTLLVALLDQASRAGCPLAWPHARVDLAAGGIEPNGRACFLPQIVLLHLHHFPAPAPLAHTVEAVPDVGFGLASGAVGLEVGPQVRLEVVEKAVECSAQRRQRCARQRRACLEHGDGVNVRANHVGAQPDGFVQRRATAHHGIKHSQPFQPAWRVVVRAVVARRELFEDGAECGAATPRPPLVQVGVGPEQVLVVHLLP